METNGEALVFFGEQEIGLLASYMELGSRFSVPTCPWSLKWCRRR